MTKRPFLTAVLGDMRAEDDQAILDLVSHLRSQFGADCDLVLSVVDAGDGQAFTNLIHAAASVALDL